MATKPAAKALLQDLLKRGRVSPEEFAVLSAALYKTNAEDRILIRGNVTVSFDTAKVRDRLEAVSPVFNTVELLEQILLNTDLEDLLLRLQLVCKRFHKTINTSLPIRRQLFVEPDWNKTSITFQPLRFCGTSVQPPKWNHYTAMTHPLSYVCLVPLRTDTFQQMKECISLSNRLITQPPLSKAITSIFYMSNPCRGRWSRFEKRSRICNDSGVRVADIIKAADLLVADMATARRVTSNAYISKLSYEGIAQGMLDSQVQELLPLTEDAQIQR